MCDLSSDFVDLLAKMPRGGLEGAVKEREVTYAKAFGAATASVVAAARRARGRLEKLSGLVRRSSLFDDAADEIAGLVHASETEMSGAAETFRAAKTELSQNVRRSKTQTYAHVAAMEAATQSELQETTRLFEAVLRRRRETLRKQSERRVAFGEVTSAHKKREERPRVPVFDDDDTNNNEQQVALLIPDQTYYHEERANGLAEVEAQVQRVGHTFGRLSSLVAQQDELVERIDGNVQEAAANVDATADVLRGRLNHMSDATSTAVKVASILAATAVIYTVFLA